MSRTTPPHVHPGTESRSEQLGVLIGAADAGSTTTFALWLESEFDTVRTATDPGAFRDAIDETIGVVVLDDDFARSQPIKSAISDCGESPRVVAIGDPDRQPTHVDEALEPPAGRMSLCQTVRSLNRQAQYDRCVAALYELATTRADVVTDGGAVEPRLEEIETRIEAIRETTDRTVEQFDEQDFKALLRDTDLR